MAKTKRKSSARKPVRKTARRTTPATKIRLVGGKVHYGTGGRALCSTKSLKGAHATKAQVDCRRCQKLAALNRSR